MYTTSITRTDKGFVFKAYDDKTMKVVYTSKEKPTHDKAKEESLNFLYARPAATGGGSGDGSGNGPKRKPFKNVVKDDSEV